MQLMVWFKVDDGLHKHRKIRKVLAENPAALALWTVAGSWSSDEGTDGFIPEDQLPWFLPAGAETLAQLLVTARLWKRVKGGYQFHQFLEDGDGTKRNPSLADVEAERRKKADAGRLGGLASGKIRSKREAPASAPAKQVLANPLNPRPDPTRPSPSNEGEAVGARPARAAAAIPPGPQPPSRCPQHKDDPKPPPCGDCGDARRAHEQWVIRKAKWDRDAPKCPRHRGQFAHNCGLCLSERKGAE